MGARMRPRWTQRVSCRGSGRATPSPGAWSARPQPGPRSGLIQVVRNSTPCSPPFCPRCRQWSRGQSVLKKTFLGGLALAATAHAAPAALFLPPVRDALAPRLAGRGDPGHVALTFDDGPHPEATPAILAVLRRYEVRATFFVLGGQLALTPRIGQLRVDDDHEIVVHGWTHRRVLGRGQRTAYGDLASTVEVVER